MGETTDGTDGAALAAGEPVEANDDALLSKAPETLAITLSLYRLVDDVESPNPALLILNL